MILSKEYFDTVAGQWDGMQQSFFSQDVRNFACRLAEIREGKIAADLGAGTGFMTHGLLQAGLKVLAVDQSLEMLALLKNKYAACENLKCLEGDSDALPIEDCSVDYAFANMFLHHVADPLVAIKEIYRILKPGGIVVITDLDKHEFTELQTEQHDVWLGFDRENLLQWFKAAGFSSYSTHCVGSDCSTQSACSCCEENKISISIFAALGEK
jgi:ubiquinone/menaquinone biosynthesis C-methylase UbiE